MEVDMLDPPPESNESVKDASVWSHYISQFAANDYIIPPEEQFKVGDSKPIYLRRLVNLQI